MTFKVTLEPSGQAFEVTEDDVILDVALANGIRMPHGCRAGTCKSCRAKIVSGSIDVNRAFPGPSFLTRTRYLNGYALLCRATATSDVVIEVDEQPILPQARQVQASIAEIVKAAADVAIVTLRLEGGDMLMFEPGQYIDLLMPDGLRRSYSIANPSRPAGVAEIELHIRRMPGGAFTDPLFDGRFGPGQTLTIEGPLGSFYLRESPKPGLLLASGTGYAPIRSLLLSALPRLKGRPMALYWGGRTEADLYGLAEARALAEAFADFSVTPVISEPHLSPGWTGRTGLVHRAVMEDFPDLSSWQVYACGAPVMVEAARSDFTALCRLPDKEFFADAFVSQADL